jgi:hypothetical protein
MSKAKRKTAPNKKPIRAKQRVKRATKVARARRAPVKEQHHQDSIDSLVTASAEALGLTIDPAWRHSVKSNLRLVLDHAARVDAFPLPDDAEPAPIFHA